MFGMNTTDELRAGPGVLPARSLSTVRNLVHGMTFRFLFFVGPPLRPRLLCIDILSQSPFFA